MDDAIQMALEKDLVIDITTTGKRTGRPSRIEIWFHNVDGQLYIIGTPGPRDWYANLAANPEFIFHLKVSAQADLPCRATPVRDTSRRREIFQRILEQSQGRRELGVSLDQWVDESPLVHVEMMGRQADGRA